MREHRRIEFVNKSSRSGNESSMKAALKIFVSTQNRTPLHMLLSGEPAPVYEFSSGLYQ